MIQKRLFKSVVILGSRLGRLPVDTIAACDVIGECFAIDENDLYETHDKAKRHLMELDVFVAISKLMAVEIEEFRQVMTDYTDERYIAKALCYFIGRELFYCVFDNSVFFAADRWDKPLSESDLNEMAQMFKWYLVNNPYAIDTIWRGLPTFRGANKC